MTMRYLLALGLSVSVLSAAAIAQGVPIPRGATVYIVPGEFSAAISAAMIKKGVPVTVTLDELTAEYRLTAETEAKREGTGERVAKVLMLGAFAGSGQSRDTSVIVTRVADNAMVWAYNTRKPNAQSAAEGVAKHFKNHISGKR